MTSDEYDALCGALPATSRVVQWGGSHVWKVGGRVFAIGSWPDEGPAITFKVSDIAFEVLREQPELRPAPYLAARGLKWMQHHTEPGLSDDALRDHIRASHRLVVQGLSQKKRVELGLTPISLARAGYPPRPSPPARIPSSVMAPTHPHGLAGDAPSRPARTAGRAFSPRRL